MVYGTKFNGPLKTSVKSGHSLDDFLQNADVTKDWEACTGAPAAPPSDGPVDGITPEPEEDETAPYSIASTVATQGRLAQYKPEDPEEDLVAQMESITKEDVDTYLTLVSSTILQDGDLRSKSVSELVADLKALKAMKAQGMSGAGSSGNAPSSVCILYDIDAASEQKHTPRKSPAPFRKQHMEDVVTAILQARHIAMGGTVPADGSGEMMDTPDPADLCPGCQMLHSELAWF